jgi:putative DNA methylase
MPYKKKLIEVALPLNAINNASSYDKLPGIGPHPKGLHQWWARLPLPTARAVLFSSIVDDPSENPQLETEKDIVNERNRLFGIVENLLKKDSTIEDFNNAKNEISNSDKNLTVIDPFCGGGSIPLESQRLGLKTMCSDLNPVAVMISKVTTQFSYEFNNHKPINPKSNSNLIKGLDYSGLSGISEDLEYYAEMVYQKVYNQAEKFYSTHSTDYKKPSDIIAWRWVRNVNCPNPSCNIKTPIARSYLLKNKGGEKIGCKAEFNLTTKSYSFHVTSNKNLIQPGNIARNGAFCLKCKHPISFKYIKKEGLNGCINAQLLAIVVKGTRKKIYINATESDFSLSQNITINDTPSESLPEKALGFRIQAYGFTKHKDLYTKRQLFALLKFSESINEIFDIIYKDAITAGLPIDQTPLETGGNGAYAYSEYIKTLLAFSLDRCAYFNSSFCIWAPTNEKVMHMFGRQAIPMVWDFSEANILGDSVGAWKTCSKYISKCLNKIVIGKPGKTKINQLDATKIKSNEKNIIFSTDPPYYDNIGYADLSDFFYIWLKRTIGDNYPKILSTILTPKNDELTASPQRFKDNKKLAKEHFEQGFKDSFQNMRTLMDPEFPISIYYAFKQTDIDNSNKSGERASTGWETMLESLIRTNFQITATWPVRAAQQWRMRAMSSNALASYIVLCCRQKPEKTLICSRKEFITELGENLEKSILNMISYNINPVDLQQAVIGPGMAIFSKYTKVLEVEGSAMTVRTALQLINAELDRIQENSDIEMDSDTRFCIQWFDTFGFDEKPYGEAETLARAKDISVDGLINAGVFVADSGKSKLKHWSKMSNDWDPRKEKRLTLWECTHYIIKELINGDGQLGAAKLAKFMGPQKADEAKELAYQLYHICDKRRWTNHAGDYNTLISNWSDIKSQIPNVSEGQETLF